MLPVLMPTFLTASLDVEPNEYDINIIILLYFCFQKIIKGFLYQAVKRALVVYHCNPKNQLHFTFYKFRAGNKLEMATGLIGVTTISK